MVVPIITHKRLAGRRHEDCSSAELERLDLARLNLLCAVGLPGSEDLDITAQLRTLDDWTRNIQRFVRDCRPHFEQNASEYDHQEGVFCFLSMVTLLKHPRGLGLGYQPRAIGSYDFSDSRDDFLHGLLTRRLGTCTSLPVLFVAIGRRLEWPMHLAVAKRHVFVQWINPNGTHLNLEGSCPGGGKMYPDDYYHYWPGALTREEQVSGRYLRPLSDAECIALFLETRGHCLVDNRRYEEAREAYAAAKEFAPTWSQYTDHLRAMELHRAHKTRGGRVAGY